MFSYDWKLADGFPAKDIKAHKTKVMTTFACGGGSSMGYKLAGYDVVAANDIDPKMARVYIANFHPKHYFLCDIRELAQKPNLPKIDLLDGSPPCTVFSTSGKTNKLWQTKHKFKEGASEQVLDDLFFEFIALAKKLQPKVVIAENVKGMLVGHTKWYTREVVRQFKTIGYTCQVFLLNAARMGVPQARERIFFIASKTGKKLTLEFNETPISVNEALKGTNSVGEALNDKLTKLWHMTKQGGLFAFSGGKTGRMNRKLDPNRPSWTIDAVKKPFHWGVPNSVSDEATALLTSYPKDYNYLNIKPGYLLGMSVPPVMMAQIAHQVYNQIIRE